MLRRFCLILPLTVLIGCGGDSTTTVIQTAPKPEGSQSGQGGATDESLSKAAFIREADALCAEFAAKLEDFGRQATPAYYRVFEDGAQNLREPEPPKPLALTYQQYLAALDDQIAATRAGDNAEYRQADARKEDAAQQIGFAECGTG